MDTVILPENGITIEIKDITVRDALRKVFGRFGYETGIVRDGIFIATEEAIIQKQLRQRVAVDAEDRPLPQVLKALAQESGANIILDPRLAKKAQENLISITLDDVPLEVAVRLVAEVGSLRTIRMSNVLFVTDDARAEKLKDDADKPFKPGNTLNPFFPSMNFPGPGGLGGGAAGGAAIPEVDR
jgi:type II secretory pathway component HofQ